MPADAADHDRIGGFRRALDQGCPFVGLSAERARLLRVGSNAVYHPTSPVVVRVSRPGIDVAAVGRTVAVACWLESAGFPAVRVLDVAQPVFADGYVLTFWHSISADGDQYASTSEIGSLLARLHHLASPSDLRLLPANAFARSIRRLDACRWLNPNDRGFLLERPSGSPPSAPTRVAKTGCRT